MKKTLVALAVSGFVAAANAAPDANSFYVGAKAGWATIHHGVTQFNSKYANDTRYNANTAVYGINRSSVTYGVFGGYQIADNLAVELGYDYYGRVRGNGLAKDSQNKDVEKQLAKHSAHGTNLALKANYVLIDGFDTFSKVGAALIRNDYKQVDAATGKRAKLNNLKTALLLGAGVEFDLSRSVGFRVEYQWLPRVGNLDRAYRKADVANTNFGYSPDIHSVSGALIYRFGQGALPVPAVIAEPEIITKNFAFSSDVLFDFGKANLKPAASESLDATHAEIQNLGLTDYAIQVNGYADRIGKDEPNLALSQRRAESVANYMVSKGVSPEVITAVGYGKANPKTGNTCDAVKGRQALIACLAPDRRVELQVQGSKQIVM